MNILVVGGTRFFGIHMVKRLLADGHQVTIATRGRNKDPFGNQVERIHMDRFDEVSVKEALQGKEFDVVCDNIAYCSNDIRILNYVKTKRYVFTSTVSIYHKLHMDTREEEYEPMQYSLRWLGWNEDSYDEIKRQAEAALYQEFGHIPSVAIRFPYVIGEDDYTNRLYFYVEHIVKEIPMKLIGEEEKITFIDSRNAGELLAWFAGEPITGTFNACNEGCMSVSEIIQYVEKKTGKKAILTEEGEAGPYNGTPSFTLNVDKLKNAGYQLPPLSSYSNQLLDAYIERALS